MGTLSAVSILVIGALAWVTHLALRLEAAEVHARADAEHQELVRLVLWRMDAVVTPILARESARPYFHYLSFYPAGRAYTRMWREVEPGEVLVPSPLLNFHDPMIRLHFQRDETGAITSPQAPGGEVRALAQSLYVSSYALASAEQSLGELQALFLSSATEVRRAGADELSPMVMTPQTLNRADDGIAQQQAQAGESLQQLAQKEFSANEYMARQDAATRANRQSSATPAQVELHASANVRLDSAIEKNQGDARRDKAADKGVVIGGDVSREPIVTQSTYAPRWISRGDGEPQLLLTRTVDLQSEGGSLRRLEQGIWIDWAELRRALLTQAVGHLPGAEVIPHAGGESPAAMNVLGRSLAAIPVELVVPAPLARALPAWSPMRGALLGAWAVAMTALIAIAMVTRAATELAERRGRFVSAVTHELRTPLTTFCLYSQMLADGMIRDEERRQEYIQTLRRESGRLAGIVESVLDYARLGRGSMNHVVEVGVVELIGRLEPSLRARCEQCGMELVLSDSVPPGTKVRVDPARFERIIVNLIDNACKYAGNADDRRVVLRLERQGRELLVGVRDFGPGLDPAEAARLFRPFYRGKAHAEGVSSGLGLGLSLARGLARELGGDLRPGRPETGAEFVLTIPLA